MKIHTGTRGLFNNISMIAKAVDSNTCSSIVYKKTQQITHTTMVRKVSKQVQEPAKLTRDEVKAIVVAESGTVKNKEVDPRKIVGSIHVKKYLAETKVNGKVEKWISVLKKQLAPLEEGETRAPLTDEEAAVLEECKAQTAEYLKDGASTSLVEKINKSTEELKNLKDISSSMKYKFSRYAYEAISHIVNLIARELLTLTCAQCSSQRAKLTKVSHIPWEDLRSQMLSGMYINTLAVFDTVHKVEPATVEAETVEVEEVETEETETDETAATTVKTTKPRLSQYISNTFKEIVSRDERFKGLLLGKEVTALVSKIIYEVLDRYANILKSLLQTANSKTVNEHLAMIATKIILQDYTHSVNEDVATVLDVVQSRIENIKEKAAEEKPSE